MLGSDASLWVKPVLGLKLFPLASRGRDWGWGGPLPLQDCISGRRLNLII